MGKDSKSFKSIQKFQLPLQIHLYCSIFLHHEAEKMKQTNWTQMLSTNKPLQFTMAYFCLRINFKEGFNEFLEAKLRGSKGVFVLFF